MDAERPLSRLDGLARLASNGGRSSMRRLIVPIPRSNPWWTGESALRTSQFGRPEASQDRLLDPEGAS
jgi:hypothetical protein